MILNRLARAMETLGRREGRSLTPRQRVAAAQRWNSLAGIGMNEYDDRYNRFIDANKYDMTITRDEELKLRKEAEDAYRAMRDLGISSTTYPFGSGWSEYADNPFLSDNVDKYREQSEFLDWCHYNHIPPTPVNLKQFRWETYQTLPYRQRQWIANKDDIRQALRDEGFVSPYADDLRTLRDVDDAALDYTGGKYDFMELPVYESLEEFPDYLDYMWRY